MVSIAENIVERSVEEEQEELSGELSVHAFAEHVREHAREHVEAQCEQCGDDIHTLIGETMAQAQGYQRRLTSLIGSENFVGHTEEQDAAGLTHMESRRVVLSTQAADFAPENRGYWQRVREHEHIHKWKQAGHYNLDRIRYANRNRLETVTVHALAEWQPSTQANQSGDLTAEYKWFVDQGNALADAIGGDGDALIEDALRTGDMQSLQAEIIRRHRENFAEQN